jgi:hypothetical protein
MQEQYEIAGLTEQQFKEKELEFEAAYDDYQDVSILIRNQTLLLQRLWNEDDGSKEAFEAENTLQDLEGEEYRVIRLMAMLKELLYPK